WNVHRVEVGQEGSEVSFEEVKAIKLPVSARCGAVVALAVVVTRLVDRPTVIRPTVTRPTIGLRIVPPVHFSRRPVVGTTHSGESLLTYTSNYAPVRA